jgi:hypothetical protein
VEKKMPELTVEFRGLFAAILSDRLVRILLPIAYDATVAKADPDNIIPPYFPFVAVQSKLITDAPDPALKVRFMKHGESDVYPTDIRARDGQLHEWTTRRERLASPSAALIAHLRRKKTLRQMPRGSAESDAVKASDNFDSAYEQMVEYSVFFVPHHRIRIAAMHSDTPSLIYNADPVKPKPEPGTNPNSINWLTRLSQIIPRANPLSSVLGDQPPLQLCAAFATLSNGYIRPEVPLKHKYRYLSGVKEFCRPIADGLFGTAEAGSTTDIYVDDRKDSDFNYSIRLTTDGKGSHVIIGNEPLDDLAHCAPIPACAQPGYQFEHYAAFYEPLTEMKPWPVPVCVSQDEGHLDPPGPRCGPPSIIG